MKLVLYYTLVLSLFFLLNNESLFAQVQTRFAHQAILTERGVFDVEKQRKVSLLPRIDVAELLEEDAFESSMGVPFRFGYSIDVNYTLSNSGTWFDRPDGRVWKLNVKSSKAYSINFIFGKLLLPDNAKLYMYNESRTMVYGPLTRENIGKSESLGTDLIQGEQVTLELFEPQSQQGKSELRISKAIHGYKNMFNIPNSFGDALECHNNVNCPPFSNWQDPSNSVALVLLADGTRLCSGALLSNTTQDFTPNFLTAFHCIDIGNNMDPCETEAGNGVLSPIEINRAQNWVFRFQYKSPTCTPSTEPLAWVTFNGSTYRAGWFDTDFALLELDVQPIMCAQYAGWSRNAMDPTSGANIHHPRGDVMKISTYNNPASKSSALIWDIGNEFCDEKRSTTPVNTHWTVTLTDGTTEGGSSGSPLFDQNRRVVGQLHGGYKGCAPIVKYYGRLDRSWGKDASGNFLLGRNASNSLAPWLDPNNTGAMTVNTVSPLYIAGPSEFCSSDTYSISNLPTGVVVNWAASPSSAVSISGGGSSIVVTRLGSYNGEVNLTATMDTPCGILSLSKDNIVVGSPSFPTFTSDPEERCAHLPYVLTPILPLGTVVTSISGLEGGVYVPLTPNFPSGYIVPPNVFGISITLQNSCGSSTFTRLFQRGNCL